MGRAGPRRAALGLGGALTCLAIACITCVAAQTTSTQSPVEQQCKSGDKVGLCLRPSQCFDNFTIDFGGEVTQFEVRSLGNETVEDLGSEILEDCGTGLWCCTYPDGEEVSTLSPKPPPSGTSSATTAPSGTPSATTSHSGTPSATTSPSGTPSVITSPSGTPSATTSPSGTSSATTSPSGTPSATTSPSGTSSATTSPSGTPSATTSPTGSPSATTSPPKGVPCARVFDECFWCAALYREGGDVSRGQSRASGLYCGGALVAPRVVLTATTCVRAVHRETVRVRLPLGDHPDRFYTVVDSIMHPNYTSGSHANDFALLVLNEAVTWDDDLVGQACMDYGAPQGSCRMVGFDQNDELVLTAATVADGPCKKRRGGGRGAEVACASLGDQCNAATGAPLLCSVTKDAQGGMVIAGVARMHCFQNGKVLLGKVQMHSDWLTQELRKLGAEPSLYTP